ncbi:MAG: hypothetical protein INR71_03570 [Terriglobus roseus]|nr:hypothetical protein [Terriglobus roseus]
MGENRPFLQMSYVFMADRVRDSDVNGSLSRLLLTVSQNPPHRHMFSRKTSSSFAARP